MSTKFIPFASGVCLAACVLTAGYCDAQVLQWRRGPAVQPAPVAQPVPAQPVPAQAAPTQPVPQPAPQPVQPQQPVAGQVEGQGQINAGANVGGMQGGQGQFIRGHSLIGMNIMGPNDQPVGTIQDFVIDSQAGGCPTIFFAVAPQMQGWNEGYVIVPFDAFQVSYDNARHIDMFRLGIAADALVRAPHLAVNSWNEGAYRSANNRHDFTDSRQFFQRTEHTVARPETGGNREQNHEQQPQLPNQPQRADMQHNQPGQQPSVNHPDNLQRPQSQQTPETRPSAEQPKQPEKQPEAARNNDRGNTPPAPNANQGRNEKDRR